MTNPTTGKPASNDANIVTSGNNSMEQIRELLFGEHQRNTEQRFANTDAGILALREQAAQDIRELEQRLSDRMDQLDKLHSGHRDALESTVQEALQALSRQFDQRVDDIQTQLQSEQMQLARELGKEQDRLQTDKVDRRQLARLLKQMADQLGAE